MDELALKVWLAEPRDEIASAIADGIRIHIAEIKSRIGKLAGYALCTGEEYQHQTISTAFTDGSHVSVPSSDDMFAYYTYSVDEWPHWEVAEEAFAPANRLISAANEKFASLHCADTEADNYDEFEVAHSEALLEAMVQGLEIAKSNGWLGNFNPFLIVWISDSENEVIFESVRRLNDENVVGEFMDEFA